jgi:hypothetical protein
MGNCSSDLQDDADASMIDVGADSVGKTDNPSAPHTSQGKAKMYRDMHFTPTNRDSDEESEPGDSYKPGEYADISDNEDDNEEDDRDEADRSEKRGRLSLDLPFEDADWMIDLPRTPDADSRWRAISFPSHDDDDNNINDEDDNEDKVEYEEDTDNGISGRRSNHSRPLSQRRASATGQFEALELKEKETAELEMGPPKIRTPLKVISFNNFRLDFSNYKPRTEIPRGCPNNSSILLDIKNDPKFDRSTSLIIYISHVYLAGFDGKDTNNHNKIVSEDHILNWRNDTNLPHPDNKDNNKFELIIKGIDFLIQTQGSKFDSCYLWLDYTCLDQTKDTQLELESIGGLKEVMSYCDCIFTPIVDKDHASWQYSHNKNLHTNWLNDYRSDLFLGNNIYKSYMKRAWCNLEMLYGYYLPLWKTGDRKYDDERCNLSSGGLNIAAKHGLRAHFIYGTKELHSGTGIIKLPPLPRGFAKNINPLNGIVTLPEQMDFIKNQLNKIEINDDKVVEYYIGERNCDGNKHGRGVFTWENGSVFDGGWLNDVQHGDNCIYKFPNGETISGSWVNGKIDGYATYVNLDGDAYYGEFNEKLLRHGTGKNIYADGDIYEGFWRDGMRHHKGRMRFKEGDEFIGFFKFNMMNGYGSWSYVGGGSFSGYFKNDRRHGIGRFSSSEDTIFEGNYLHGKKHGKGKTTYSNGTILEGEWVMGKLEGTATYTTIDGVMRTVTNRSGSFVNL